MTAHTSALDLRQDAAAARGRALHVPARDARPRVRALFAACYALVVALEAITYAYDGTRWDGLDSVWRFSLSACIDAAAWWACIALAEAGGRTRAPGTSHYAVATVVATLVATYLHLVTETWFFAPDYDVNPGRALGFIWMLHLIGLWRAAVVTIAYVFRLRSLADNAALHATLLQQAALARKVVEGNLRAMQGRIDPRFLFESLAQVERLCESEPGCADRILEALIVHLRVALPETDDKSRMLASELALAQSYVELVRARTGDALALVVDADSTARAAVLPPMLLLPLVQHACGGLAAPGSHLTLALAALVERDRLRVVVRACGTGTAGTPADERVAFVERQLCELHGAAASLVVRTDGAGETRLTLEVPYERADGSHR